MNKLKKINLFLASRAPTLVFSAIIFYLILFSLVSLWKYYNFGYNGLDLAIINQVFYNSSQGQFFASSIHPPTYLGDHFAPILFLILPFYFLSRRPETLLILQTVVLAFAAWPIYLIAKKVLDKSWGVILAIIWLVNPFVANLNLFEFSFLPFAIFFIFWAFYFYQEQKFLPFFIFSLLALLVREDVALVIFMFGLIAFLEKKKIKWWLTPAILSAIYFILAIKISGLFSATSQYKFLLYYSWLGNSWSEIIKNLCLHPWWLIPKIFNPGSLVVFLGLLLPVAYLPLLKPKHLLLSALIFIQLVIGVSWQWLAVILFTQYSALLLPGILLASIFGLKELIEKKSKNQILNFFLKEKALLTIIVLSAVIYSALILGPLAGSLKQIINQGLILPETKIKKDFMAKVPPQTAVATTYDFLAPLSSRQNLASLNYVFLGKQQFLATDYFLPPKTDYLLIDYKDLVTYQLQYGVNPIYQKQYLKGLAFWPKVLADFGLVAIKDSLALYQKGATNKFTLVEILAEQPKLMTEQEIELDQNFKFLGFNKLNQQYQLFWQVNLPLEKSYQLKLTLNDGQNLIDQKIYPFAYDLLAVEQNGSKKIIQTNYWFEFWQKIPAGTYNLKINLIQIVDGQLELNSVRSTENAIKKEVLIGPEINLSQIIL